MQGVQRTTAVTSSVLYTLQRRAAHHLRDLGRDAVARVVEEHEAAEAAGDLAPAGAVRAAVRLPRSQQPLWHLTREWPTGWICITIMS